MISLKFVPKVPKVDNIPTLVQIMAWRCSGDKPLSEPMMISLLMHICITRPQWVNSLGPRDAIWLKTSWSILAQVITLSALMMTRSNICFIGLDNGLVINDGIMMNRPINSSPPSAAYMRQWTGSSLVQVMPCRLFGAKPLPEPKLTYCQLDNGLLGSYFSEIWIGILSFSYKKMQLKMSSAKWWPFCPGGDELSQWGLVKPLFKPMLNYHQ